MTAKDEASLAPLLESSNAPAIDWKAGRRAFLTSIGAGIGLAALGQAAHLGEAKAQGITDFDILNFALNLEYLEAEFYLRAAFGRGLAPDDTTGKGRNGPTVGGNTVPFENQEVRNFARELAIDEERHVKFLRAVLGANKIAKPTINLRQSFTLAARAAGIIRPSQQYNAFASENHFLIASFIFEDVGVTAYKGAAPLISDKGILEAAAGILAVEAYHAGAIRNILYTRGMGANTGEDSLFNQAAKISNLRDAADGPGDQDQGLGTDRLSNIVPTDENGIAFSRGPAQVIDIVTLGGDRNSGGFFPDGLNGTIR